MTPLETFLQQLVQAPETVTFADTITAIDSAYDFTPTTFRNDTIENAAGQNNGSCKIFAFAQLQGLDCAQTLACFGDFYRKDVLEHSQGTDHQNIRNFMVTGWDGIEFSGTVLSEQG